LINILTFETSMELHEGEQEEPGSDQEDALFDGDDDE
jgi:hypothetical protein